MILNHCWTRQNDATLSHFQHCLGHSLAMFSKLEDRQQRDEKHQHFISLSWSALQLCFVVPYSEREYHIYINLITAAESSEMCCERKMLGGLPFKHVCLLNNHTISPLRARRWNAKIKVLASQNDTVTEPVAEKDKCSECTNTINEQQAADTLQQGEGQNYMSHWLANFLLAADFLDTILKRLLDTHTHTKKQKHVN